MKKTALSLTLAIFELITYAQTGGFSARASIVDSSRYDIGYLTLDGSFTQHVTIRGEDLEKMPVVNLSDALRPWLFGTYTGPLTVAYVVDGNPVTDVDIYPLYEIAEVTLVQNAVATAGYGNGQQELVLVTTKRGKGPGGWRVAAQAGLVNGDRTGTATNTGLYHQYYVGAYHNADKLSYGVSAGWQRDIQPGEESSFTDVYTPDNLQRWRMNGWMEWRPDPKNTIGLKLGYLPQRTAYADSAVDQTMPSRYSSQAKGHLLIPELSWEGRWSRGLRNKFDAEYLYGRGEWESDELYLNSQSIPELDDFQTNTKLSHLVFRDRLIYETKAGNWRISPSLDLSYQHIDERTDIVSFQQTNMSVLYNGLQEQKGSLFYITPAINMSLARAFDIGGGLAVNGSSKVEPGNRRLFPFVTATLDLLHLSEAASGGSLKVSGSYARRSSRYIDDYSMSDLVTSGGGQTLYDVYHNTTGYLYSNGQTGGIGGFAGNEPGYWAWGAGAAYGTADGRVTLQYYFERRNMSYMISEYSGLTGYEPWAGNFHHIDLRFKPIDSKSEAWLTGFTVNLMRSKGDTTGFQPFSNYVYGAPAGDVYPSGLTWTGGWVNRLRFGRFSAGLDLLYHFGEKAVGSAGGVRTLNPVVVPNVYAGYQWKLGTGALEVFLQGSGLVRYANLSMTDIPDNRRYVTIGGSYAL